MTAPLKDPSWRTPDADVRLVDLYLERCFLFDLIWQNAAEKEHRQRLAEIRAEIAQLEEARVDARWKSRYGKP